MKKAVKIGLGVGLSLVAVAGSAAGVSYALLNKTNSTTSEGSNIVAGGTINNSTGLTGNNVGGIQFSNPNEIIQSNGEITEDILEPVSEKEIAAITDKNGHKIATFSLETFTRGAITDETQFVLSIHNLTEKLGQIEFVQSGQGVESITVTPNTKVQVRAKANTVVAGYELYDLDVHCTGNESYYLDTAKDEDGTYSFTLPSSKISTPEGEKQNPFYNGSTTIEVNAIFAPSQIESWTYDFNNKSYKYQVTTDDFLLDDYQAKMAMTDVNETNNNPVNYVLDMNGHNVYVGTYTVPKGCNLIIIDSTVYKNPNAPKHKLMNGNPDEGNKYHPSYGHIILGGLLTKYSETFITPELQGLDPETHDFRTWQEYVEVTSMYQLENSHEGIK